jgi:hypothetical protein
MDSVYKVHMCRVSLCLLVHVRVLKGVSDGLLQQGGAGSLWQHARRQQPTHARPEQGHATAAPTRDQTTHYTTLVVGGRKGRGAERRLFDSLQRMRGEIMTEREGERKGAVWPKRAA